MRLAAVSGGERLAPPRWHVTERCIRVAAGAKQQRPRLFRSRFLSLAMLVLTGCGGPPVLHGSPRPASPSARVAVLPPGYGTPADVRTVASSQGEVDVMVACRDPGVGIAGKGEIGRPPREDAIAFTNWANGLSRQIECELGELTAGVGYGHGCTAEQKGHRIYVRRWTDIDAAVERLRALVARERLRSTFFVTVLEPVELL